MENKEKKSRIVHDVEAVITSYNQGVMIQEAVQSLCRQTALPARIIIVDDGSVEEESVRILEKLEKNMELPIPVVIHWQENRGVSAARNTGIGMTQTPLVLILDGDDRIAPQYIEEVSQTLREDKSVIAASSRIKTFGVLEAEVCPKGGSITSFLSRNNCPAIHILRREIWEKCGGYDETMRSGFEDWEYFLSMLETNQNAHIKIVEKSLIEYRTMPASSNIKSMQKRLELMKYIIEKHRRSYEKYVLEAIIGLEEISISRLYGWENEMLQQKKERQNLSGLSKKFMKNPTYGDGGMAAAVRIASYENSENQSV